MSTEDRRNTALRLAEEVISLRRKLTKTYEDGGSDEDFIKEHDLDHELDWIADTAFSLEEEEGLRLKARRVRATEDRSVEMIETFPSSIEVNRGMKGDVGWSIKIRGADGDEFDLVDRVAAIDAALSIRFRKPNPTLEEQLGASIDKVKGNGS